MSVSLYFHSNINEIEHENNESEKENVNVQVHTNGNAPDNHVTKMSTTTNSCDLNNAENPYFQPNSSETMKMPKCSLSHAIQRIGRHIRTSYSNATVIQWSVLWAMSMCGFLQVRSIPFHFNYVSLLLLRWSHIPFIKL